MIQKLVVGSPSDRSVIDEVAVVPSLGITNFEGGPKVLEWALDPSGGKRVSIPCLNPGSFSLLWTKTREKAVGKKGIRGCAVTPVGM